MKNFVISCVCGLLIGSIGIILNYRLNEKVLNKQIDDLNKLVFKKDAEIRKQDKDIYDLKVENNKIHLNVEKTNMAANSYILIQESARESKNRQDNREIISLKDQLNSNKRNYEAELAKLKRQISELEKSNEMFRSQIDNGVQNREACFVENKKLRTQIKELQSQLNNKKFELRTIKDKLIETKNELIRCKASISHSLQIGNLRSY